MCILLLNSKIKKKNTGDDETSILSQTKVAN